jgi:hypothetical protein
MAASLYLHAQVSPLRKGAHLAEPRPDALSASSVVVGVLELRERLELILRRAHHRVIGGPVVSVG